MTAPEPLAEQLARHAANRRHARRSRAIVAAGVLVLAVAGVVWPPLLVGLWWLTTYCVVMAALWYGANRLAVRLGRRRPAPPAVPEPETHVRIVADVVTDRDVPND
jgi:predicted DNA repair protein MutK